MTIPISHSRLSRPNPQVQRVHGKNAESAQIEQSPLPTETVSVGSTPAEELPSAFKQIGISPKLLERFTEAKRAHVPSPGLGPLSVALYFSLDNLDPETQGSDMQGRELDYVSKLNSKQKFETLADGLKNQDVSIASHYTDPRSGLQHFHSQLDGHLDEKGLVPGQLPLLVQSRANETLDEGNRKLLDDSVERLSQQFFGDVPQDKSAMKFFLGTFTRHLSRNGKDNPQEALSLKETHQLLSHMSAAVYHQERAANETPIGDHGIDHLIKHNVNGVQMTFDQLQEKGVPITAKDRLLASMVMVYHDMGYTAPSVVESTLKTGIRGQDKGHGVVGARYVRELSEQQGTPFQKLLKPEDWNLFHRGVLYHDRTQEALPVEKFVLSDKPTPEERVHNFESAVRLADNAHGFSSKVSKPLAKNPESLKYLRMMQVAGNLKKEGLETGSFSDSFFKEKLGESWAKLDGVLPERLLKGGEKLTELLTPSEADFISGRLMDSDPSTRLLKDGGVEVLFPTGKSPMRQFGVATETRQQVKMVEDLDPRSKDGTSGMLEVSYMPITQDSQSDFMQKLTAIFFDDPDFRTFNQTENSCRDLSESSASILNKSENSPSPESWLQDLSGNPVLSDSKLRRSYDRISKSGATPLERVAAFRTALQQHRKGNFLRFCEKTEW
jgi:hypothetical protein